MNAFTLGVRSVLPEATVSFYYINSWFKPYTEAAAAQQMLDDGIRVVGLQTDSLGPADVLMAAGGYFAASNTDEMRQVP